MTAARASRLSAAAFAAGLALLLAWAGLSAVSVPFDLTSVLDGISYGALMLGMSALGMLITRREPRNAVGWIFCATPLLVSVSVGFGSYAEWAAHRHPGAPGVAAAAVATNCGWVPGLVGFALFLPLLFPDGRPPGPRWRIVLWLDMAAIAAVFLLLLVQPGWLKGVSNPIGIRAAESPFAIAPVAGLILLLIPAGLVSAVVRYRRAGTTERLQLRECVAAAIAAFVGFFLISVFSAREILYNLDYALIPAAVGLAMLRYRLYEVDVVIRRTLTYVLLAGTLAVIYLAGVGLIGGGLRSLTGQSSALAVTVSTLAAAAAFQPLRRRIQHVVNRRFYRSRYDAEAVVEAFSGRLREQIDLDALHRELLVAVSGAVQPAHASLWLRPVTVPERAAGTPDLT
jgi:hypothetical protein